MDKFLSEIHLALGITAQHLQANRLAFHAEPPLQSLQVVAIDFEGKPFILVASAAAAWLQMKAAAAKEQVSLMPFSGFRSYLHQKCLIEKRLSEGRKLDNILTHIAIPGFSEHHSGCAVDLHEGGRPLLEEDFEKTDAFTWLTENAAKFEFRLSYPRENSAGIIYEPWHWFYTGR